MCLQNGYGIYKVCQIALASLSLLLSGCFHLNNTDYRMMPYEIAAGQDEAVDRENVFVREIMNPSSKELRRGQKLRVLTLDGRRRFVKFEAFVEDSMVVKPLWKELEPIAIKDLVFVEVEVNKSPNLWSLFPNLEPSLEGDALWDCDALLFEVVRVDVLRRAINLEIFNLRFEMVNATISLALHDLPVEQLKRNEKARNAVSERMVRLLRLSSDGMCLRQIPNGKEIEAMLLEIDRLKSAKESGDR